MKKNKPVNTFIFVLAGILVGILAFFAFRERRIDAIRERLNHRSDEDNLNQDWMNVGDDLSSSMKRLTV
jgi:hypothetical protein